MTSLDPRGRARTPVPDQGAAVRTGSFDALGHVFAVRCDDPSFGLFVEAAFQALAVTAEPDGWYDLRSHHGRSELTWEDKVVAGSTDRASAFGWLRWDVNRRAVASADAEVVLHAGCVAQGEHAIVISGAVGCGKSTLVAALTSEGLEYLTDEAVPVDVCTGQVRAFPQPMALDDHSLDLLPEIAALPSPPDTVFHKRVVPLHPSRAALEHSVFDVAMVLFPERDASGLTILEPVSRGEAVLRLAEECFNFPDHGGGAIDALALLSQGAVAYRVTGDDPRAAASAVVDTLATSSSHVELHGRNRS